MTPDNEAYISNLHPGWERAKPKDPETMLKEAEVIPTSAVITRLPYQPEQPRVKQGSFRYKLVTVNGETYESLGSLIRKFGEDARLADITKPEKLRAKVVSFLRSSNINSK